MPLAVHRVTKRMESPLRIDLDLVAMHEHHGAGCLLYTSDAADERSSVDLGGRRIIKKKNKKEQVEGWMLETRIKRTMQGIKYHRRTINKNT